MAKVVIYDEKGRPKSVEAVDAREMMKAGVDKDGNSVPSPYRYALPGDKNASLADVPTEPGEPQYPPTPQPEHPLPGPHQVLQDGVREGQQSRDGKKNAPLGVDKDGKAIQPPATGQPFPVPPNAPQFANTVKPAVPPGSPGTPPGGGQVK